MKPLILTNWLIPDFIKADFADLASNLYFRFVWGQLPSPDELAAHLGPRTADHGPEGGHHWLDFAAGDRAKTKVFGISAWLNFASNTRAWNSGSTRIRPLNCN
jgi:hypothetical protein